MAPDSECNYACSGDANQTCGGLWRNSIYFTGNGVDLCFSFLINFNALYSPELPLIREQSNFVQQAVLILCTFVYHLYFLYLDLEIALFNTTCEFF